MKTELKFKLRTSIASTGLALSFLLTNQPGIGRTQAVESVDSQCNSSTYKPDLGISVEQFATGVQGTILDNLIQNRADTSKMLALAEDSYRPVVEAKNQGLSDDLVPPPASTLAVLRSDFGTDFGLPSQFTINQAAKELASDSKLTRIRLCQGQENYLPAGVLVLAQDHSDPEQFICWISLGLNPNKEWQTTLSSANGTFDSKNILTPKTEFSLFVPVKPQNASQPKPEPLPVSKHILDGMDEINMFGLQNNVVSLTYGRPFRPDDPGSLSVITLASEGWQTTNDRTKMLAAALQGSSQAFNPDNAYKVLNFVYFPDNNKQSSSASLPDAFINDSFKYAPNRGLVAPSFHSPAEMQNGLDGISKMMGNNPDALRKLSLSLDIEYFPATDNSPKGQVNWLDMTQMINDYANRHQSWDPEHTTPGFVFVYTINPDGEGGIINLSKSFQQYYPDQGIFVVPIVDGFGSLSAKQVALDQTINRLTQNPRVSSRYPALVGGMEFTTMWDNKYDVFGLSGLAEYLSLGTFSKSPIHIWASQ